MKTNFTNNNCIIHIFAVYIFRLYRKKLSFQILRSKKLFQLFLAAWHQYLLESYSWNEKRCVIIGYYLRVYRLHSMNKFVYPYMFNSPIALMSTVEKRPNMEPAPTHLVRNTYKRTIGRTLHLFQLLLFF